MITTFLVVFFIILTMIGWTAALVALVAWDEVWSFVVAAILFAAGLALLAVVLNQEVGDESRGTIVVSMEPR